MWRLFLGTHTGKLVCQAFTCFTPYILANLRVIWMDPKRVNGKNRKRLTHEITPVSGLSH